MDLVATAPVRCCIVLGMYMEKSCLPTACGFHARRMGVLAACVCGETEKDDAALSEHTLPT